MADRDLIPDCSPLLAGDAAHYGEEDGDIVWQHRPVWTPGGFHLRGPRGFCEPIPLRASDGVPPQQWSKDEWLS